MSEVWKDILGFEGMYRVSTIGSVYSYRANKILSLWKDKDGYLRCNLKKDGYVRQASVHRLVAETFLDNPLRKMQINHKNGVKNDNRLENLEWCTNSENQRHKVDVLGCKPTAENIRKLLEGSKRYHNSLEGKRKLAELARANLSRRVIDMSTGIVYSSQREASDNTQCPQSAISRCCNNQSFQSHGHIFKFYTDGEE